MRKRKTLGDIDEDKKKEQAKAKKILEFRRNTFKSIGYPDGVELTKYEDVNIGDIIVSKLDYDMIYTYYLVTEKNDKEITSISCDVNGLIIADPSRQRDSYMDYNGNVRSFYVKHKPTDIPKTKVIDHLSVWDVAKDIPIFNNADDKNRQYGYRPFLYDGKNAYYLVVGDVWGFVVTKDMFHSETSTEELLNKLQGLKTLKSLFEGKKGLINQTILGDSAVSDVAKNVRTFLKYHFPNTKFNVSSERGYWGTIYVKYTDSISEAKVSEITSLFEMEWDGDLMSDYHSYKDTLITSFIGGVHAVRIDRSFSRDIVQKVKKIIPELATDSEVDNDGFRFDDIKEGLKREFGYTPGSWDDIEFAYSRLSINSLLQNVDIDTKIEKKVNIPLTPTEKKIKQAIGSGNIIAPIGSKGEYMLAKKPTKNQMRIWSVSYSQWSVEKKQREKLEAAGLKVEVGRGGFYITNYPDILKQIEKERKQLGIPETYSKISFYMLMHLMDRLESINSNIKYDRKWNKRRY